MIELQIGQVYTNRNGAQYKVIGTTIAGTIMQRISDTWPVLPPASSLHTTTETGGERHEL